MLSIRLPDEIEDVIESVADEVDASKSDIGRYYLFLGLQRQQMLMRYKILDTKLDLLMVDQGMDPSWVGDALERQLEAADDEYVFQDLVGEVDGLMDHTDLSGGDELELYEKMAGGDGELEVSELTNIKST